MLWELYTQPSVSLADKFINRAVLIFVPYGDMLTVASERFWLGVSSTRFNTFALTLEPSAE